MGVFIELTNHLGLHLCPQNVFLSIAIVVVDEHFCKNDFDHSEFRARWALRLDSLSFERLDVTDVGSASSEETHRLP